MSYSTPAAFYLRIGPRLLQQVLIPAGATDPDDTVVQGFLDKAMLDIDVRIGHRTNADAVALLAGLEEQIALWFAWGHYRAFGPGETQAAGAYESYQNIIRLLDSGRIEQSLPPDDPPVDPITGSIESADWSSAVPIYTKDNLRSF